MSIYNLFNWGCIKIFWAKGGDSERKPWHKATDTKYSWSTPIPTSPRALERMSGGEWWWWKSYLVMQAMKSLWDDFVNTQASIYSCLIFLFIQGTIFYWFCSAGYSIVYVCSAYYMLCSVVSTSNIVLAKTQKLQRIYSCWQMSVRYTYTY